jgi:hypothetical protein
VSNEEVAIAARMRAIKREAQQLRQRAPQAADARAAEEPQKTAARHQRLGELRTEWQALSAQLARATDRKHMMLGHAPWDTAPLDPPA